MEPTRFGSLRHYEKGGVEVINDDARNYVFSNIFEVASKSPPFEKVAVGKNIEYVIEAIRVEGTSGWRAPAQDEFALVMDGEVEIRLLKLDNPAVVPAGTHGSIVLAGTPAGRKMGVVKARRGHMTLLPLGAAYQFHGAQPEVVLLQTLAGSDTIERWAERSARRPRGPRLQHNSRGNDDMSSTADTVPEIGSIELNQHGYRSFTLGSFAFTRDEYFAQSGKISTLRHRPPHSWPPAP